MVCGAVVICSVQCGADSEGRFLRQVDQKTIEITGTGEASIRAAFEISKRYVHPLRMFDMDYSFDIKLNGIVSVAQLRERISGSK